MLPAIENGLSHKLKTYYIIKTYHYINICGRVQQPLLGATTPTSNLFPSISVKTVLGIL